MDFKATRIPVALFLTRTLQNLRPLMTVTSFAALNLKLWLTVPLQYKVSCAKAFMIGYLTHQANYHGQIIALEGSGPEYCFHQQLLCMLSRTNYCSGLWNELDRCISFIGDLQSFVSGGSNGTHQVPIRLYASCVLGE